MTREGLIAYDRWLTENKWGSSEIITPEQAADLYLAKHPLPPAEGAEAIVKKYEDEYDFKFHWVQRDRVIRMMREFAAQSQPTAEGAEEIDELIKKHVPINAANFEFCVKHNLINGFLLQGIRDVATLHAQRIADKMVSERLREALTDWADYWNELETGHACIMKEDIDEYLKTRDSHE